MKALFPQLDFVDFHERELPERLALGHGAIAAAALAGVRPIAFRVGPDRVYTYVPRDGGVGIEPGEEKAETIVVLGEGAWSAFVHELRTIHGLFFSDGLRFERGGFEDLDRWEPALRAMLHGRPAYDARSADLRDREGRPLDAARSFRLADDDLEMGHQLRETGFLHVKGVFERSEIEALRAEVERLRAGARKGDRESWWSTTASGETVLCRLIYAGRRSEQIAALDDDARVRRLAGLAGEIVRPTPDRMDGHIVVLKIPGSRDGLADLPWHIDCGLGGHSILCPSVLVGIQLDAATPETGQLHFLPGSWRTACSQIDDARARTLPTVAVATEAGDCTVHLGDVVHGAPAQTGAGPGRRTLYVQFYNPAVFGVIEPGQGFNDMLLDVDSAVPRSTVEMLRR